MKLKYSKPMPSEGGAAVPGCGTIHISEVKPTLTKLSDDLEFPFDLNDFVVGSTGKAEYSGDIDVVIDKVWYDGTVEELHTDLKAFYGNENTARHGSLLHLKCPIENFDEQYKERLPRNGFVQVDFMFGDLEWERFFHYSHGSESGYKGFHRNIAISAITRATAIVFSNDLDDYGRPVSLERWKWSPKGLLRVIRSSQPRANGAPGWLKTQSDAVIAGPYKDKDFIAGIIFPVDGMVNDLDSLETILAAIKRNYPATMQDTIYKRIAESFNEKDDALYFSYPPEIEQYFNPNDK
jgi:hypothetical protein